jgi:hypothetical protein
MMPFLILVAFLAQLRAVPTQQVFPASEIAFDYIAGFRGGDESREYLLLGTGFFRAPRSGDEDSLIVSWLAEHPKALATQVTEMGPWNEDNSSRLVYVWVTDGEHCLNEHLVRQGAFPGRVMMDCIDAFRDEDTTGMSDEGPVEIRRLVPDAIYEAFIWRIIAAEAAAAVAGLGVWNDVPP